MVFVGCRGYGNGNQIFPVGIPIWGYTYGDPHKIPVGMGIEIPLPRQPWVFDINIY